MALTFKSLIAASRRPVVLRARRIIRRIVATTAVILAVVLVTTVTVDLGPALRSQAEQQGSRFLGRPMHIGSLSVRLWSGEFVVEDLLIEGFPESRPFLSAKRIAVSMPWRTLFDRRVVLDTIDMSDWNMFVEIKDGSTNFPKLPRRGERGPSQWTTTLQYVRAHRGEFMFIDHGTPWSIVARNLDVRVAKPANDYRGQATFTNGTVTMQSYVPFRVDMDSTFKVDGGVVRFDRITLDSEGAETALVGAVDLTQWPEQTYQLTSKIDFPKQKSIWFAKDDFTVAGTGMFTGTFHMFKEQLPDGRTRTGRELTGTFTSATTGVNDYRFTNLRGSVRWVPESLAVSNATATVYGGSARFRFEMAPIGIRGRRPDGVFDASYQDVDLTTFTEFLALDGLRLGGRASGRNFLQWPIGRFAERHGDGEVRVVPPSGTRTMTRRLDEEPVVLAEAAETPEASAALLAARAPVAVAADLSYAYGPEWVDIAPGRIATARTFVELEGRTAYGEDSRVLFHVSSADWQESDRVFASVLTAFGARTGIIPIGGSGTFDGVMTGSFRRPHIEGTFVGERMRAFDVEWGSARGEAVIENSYATVKNVVITAGESAIETEGRFSLGFPRRDGGEEIDARLRITGRPLAELRHAFELDDYDIDGALSGEFHVYGRYQRPLGVGTMTISRGVAYGEPFDSAIAALRFEGDGVRLDNLQVVKGSGHGTGAAFVGWNGTYSFNFDGRNIPMEAIAAAQRGTLPLSGVVEFTASGSGTFDAPRYTVQGIIRDLFVADEGIGQVVGDIDLNGNAMTVKLEAASPRLAVSGAGRIILPEMNAELSFTVADTSLDPYIRAFNPTLSPYTTAVASGTVRVRGPLGNTDELLVDASVDRFDLRLFDYQLRNASPIRIALDRHSVRLADMRLVGDGTELDVSGVVALHEERIAIRATGDANLGILQGFVSNIRSSGSASLSATLEGPLRDPVVSGTLSIENGRIRHFGLPHALESINGDVEFDSRGVNLDGLVARLGGGNVQFGGRIDKQGYLPGRLDVVMYGQNLALRFPEGMRSRVDVTLVLQGTVDAATMSGDVYVREATYTEEFGTPGGLFGSDDDAGGGGFGGAGPGTTIPLRFDVQINAPSSLRVRNRTANLQATANLQLRGTYDRPLLFGRAQVERGEVEFEGRRYQVTRGTIEFNNPTRIEPFIDVEAETRVRVPGETYRVTVRESGVCCDRLGPPELSSDPPLSSVEILALLFSDVAPGSDVELQRYRTDITTQEQLVREQMARRLTGSLSSGVGRVVEQTFGVDTFQLTPTLADPNQQSSRLEPGARVTLGKRLSDRAYLTYSRSLASTTRDQIIQLEYDQTDRYSWIMSRNEDGTYALEVRVRHTF